MKNIYVFSDTHRSIDRCVEVLNNTGKADAIIHCGDLVSDAETIGYIFPDIPMYNVRGNCDSLGTLNELEIIIDGVKIFITHGHMYAVKSTLMQIRMKGKEIGADIVVFGHTHKPICDTDGKMTVLNPGSARDTHTYAVIKIENGKVRADIHEF